jgi:Flp pilus assembly secretin CpaC
MRLALLLTAALLAAFPASAETLTVNKDQSTRIMLSRPARDVVVGNPQVADVTLLDARNIVVLGKGYGLTSVLAVDHAGRTIVDHQIMVGAPDVGAVSLLRGAEVQTYACAPLCERTAGKDVAAKTATP